MNQQEAVQLYLTAYKKAADNITAPEARVPRTSPTTSMDPTKTGGTVDTLTSKLTPVVQNGKLVSTASKSYPRSVFITPPYASKEKPKFTPTYTATVGPLAKQPKAENPKVLGMSPLTAGLVGGGAVAALGGGTALLIALRKRAKKKREQAGSEK